MSPEKREALFKLREQEIALDKQSFAIQSALTKLDTAYIQHSSIGSSLYSSLFARNAQHRVGNVGDQGGISERTRDLTALYSKFSAHVSATNNFRFPALSTPSTPGNTSMYDTSYTSHNDDNESYIGVDVLSQTRQQLHKIREKRATTLAQRLQQKQEALIAAEQARLDALHEVRHRAAMEIAGRHLLHRCCWAAVKRLYRHAKLRSKYALADFKWRVVAMLSVLNRLVRYVRMHSQSLAPYLALRQRTGWRQFYRSVQRLTEEHLLDVQADLVAHSYRTQRCCRRVLLEMYRAVHRKHLTDAKIDHFNLTNACRRALAVMKERLLGQQDERLVRQDKILAVELSQTRIAFAELRRSALRGRRNRALIVSDNVDRATHALRCFDAFARRGAHMSRGVAEGVSFHAEYALGRALRAWRSSTTLRAHRRYCSRLAIANTTSLSRATGSPWLRAHAADYLTRWRIRTHWSLLRAQPLRHFKSKRYRQKVLTLLRSWRLRLVTTKLKRSAARAKVRLFGLRVAWARYLAERQGFCARARQHREALVKSRNLLRSKHLADGFADFRAYVLESRERRMQVKLERRERALAGAAALIACLKQRLTARTKRRAATLARLQVVLRHGLHRWQHRAQLKLVARGRSQRRRWRAEQLTRSLEALGAAARTIRIRRKKHMAALQAATASMKNATFTAWLAFRDNRLTAHASYQQAKHTWRKWRLKEGLEQWVRKTAATSQLTRRGVFKVAPSVARRVSFLHRWAEFVADTRAKRGHALEYACDREKIQARTAIQLLRNAVQARAEEARLVATYREHTLMPLLQARFFTQMLRRREAAEERRSDPRLQHRVQRTCRTALRTWRAFRKHHKLHARSLAVGDRNHVIISSIQALTQWRNITRLRVSLVEAARQAARLYRRKYFAPAFKNWLRNTAALAHQFDARYLKHGDLLRRTLARRVLTAFRRLHSLRRRLKRRSSSAAEHIRLRRLHEGRSQLHTASMTLKQRAARRKAASAHRSNVLQRLIFNGFKQFWLTAKAHRAVVQGARAKHSRRVLKIVFAAFRRILAESETPGFGRACRYQSKRCLRRAMAVLQQRLKWKRRGGRTLPYRRRNLLEQGVTALKLAGAVRRHRKAEGKRLATHFSSALCRRYLHLWIANRFARRTAQLARSSAPVKVKSLADMWNFSGAAASSDGPSARRGSASSASSFAGALGLVPAAPSPLRRQSGSVLPSGGGRSPVPLSRAPSLGLVRRRSSVNAVSFSQQRRHRTVFAALSAYAVSRKQEKAHLQSALSTMVTFHQHAHLAQWSAWMREVVAEKLRVIQAAVHEERRLATRLLPALRRVVEQRRHLHDARGHCTHARLMVGWRRWANYACTGLRRARAQAKALQRAREREAGKRAAPQFVDDDFSHRRSSLLGSPATPATAAVAAAAVAEPRDHRVTVQRVRLLHAADMHLVHSAAHALARWRHRYRVQHQHRKLVYACLHRQLETVLQRFQQHLERAKHRRAALRTAYRWRRHYLLRHSYRLLQQHRLLSKALRQLLGLRTKRILALWRLKVRYRAVAKTHLLLLEDIHRTRMLQVAFAEWRADCAVEASLVQGLRDLRRHRLHHGVDHLVYNCKVRRRGAALQLRSRKFKTHRLLHKVFESILVQMSVHYRSKEVLRDSARFHLRYRCGRVLYNLFYLRRNRIAKDHSLALKFRALVAALRVNKAVVRYNRDNVKKANNVLLRKTLWTLFKQAKLQKATSRRLRALHPQRAGLLHHSVALAQLSRRSALQRALRRFGANITSRRRQKRQDRRSAYACMERRVRRSFRLLLSHCRRGSLRRRNSQALYAVFLNLQLRRAVSRLDVNVSHKWAAKQELRLMRACAASRTKGQVLRVLGAHGLDRASGAVVAQVLGGRQSGGCEGAEDGDKAGEGCRSGQDAQESDEWKEDEGSALWQ
jgi:hypothetical protein